jgi:hypothetical protein
MTKIASPRMVWDFVANTANPVGSSDDVTATTQVWPDSARRSRPEVVGGRRGVSRPRVLTLLADRSW